MKTVPPRGENAPSPPVPPQDGLFSIGDMARTFNVSQRALRFYEDRGLLRPQRKGSMRLYDARERRKLELVLRGKRLGFTLTEINAFVAANGAEAGRLSLDREQVAQQLAHLERQLAGLTAAIDELRATQQHLERSGPLGSISHP